MSDVWKARKYIAGVVEGLERSDRTQDVRGAHQQRLRIPPGQNAQLRDPYSLPKANYGSLIVNY